MQSKIKKQTDERNQLAHTALVLGAKVLGPQQPIQRPGKLQLNGRVFLPPTDKKQL